MYRRKLYQWPIVTTPRSPNAPYRLTSVAVLIYVQWGGSPLYPAYVCGTANAVTNTPHTPPIAGPSTPSPESVSRTEHIPLQTNPPRFFYNSNVTEIEDSVRDCDANDQTFAGDESATLIGSGDESDRAVFGSERSMQNYDSCDESTRSNHRTLREPAIERSAAQPMEDTGRQTRLRQRRARRSNRRKPTRRTASLRQN